MSCQVTEDVTILVLVKGDERYVFHYTDANRAEALRMLGRFASNPELSFTWYDVAVLAQKIRQQAADTEAAPQSTNRLNWRPPCPPSANKPEQ